MRRSQRTGLQFSARELRLAGASAAALTLALVGAGSAFAQDNTPKSSDASSVKEVVITGSHIVRSTFNTPNPVTVISEQEIQKLNLSNAGDIVAQLPQNSNFFAGNNVGLGNFNVGAQLVNLRGLNPYFGTRTLTLIDGDRVVPTTAGGGVDVTLIPSMLVGRVETETGGASAIYGSDAIAGVVNIILDTKLEGFKGQADFSQTKYGDGQDYHASMAYGHGFDNGRGHFIIGGEFEHSEAIGICSQVRGWCATNQTVYTNPDYNTPGTPGYGQPHYIVGPNGVSENATATGVLAPCAPVPGVCVNTVPQMQFSPDGQSLTSYTPGAYASGAFPFGSQQGGDGVGAYDETTMRPDVRKYTALAHLDYDITDHITGSLEAWFARSVAVNPVANGAIGPTDYELSDAAPLTFLETYPITTYNAFLTPAEAAYVGSAGGGVANFGSNVIDEVEAQNRTNNDTWRLTGALKGDLGGSWGWDAHAEYGDTITQQRLIHNVDSDFLDYSLDAVKNGAGQIVCGVTIPGQMDPFTGAPYTAGQVAEAAENGGCQPLNLFGSGNASQAAINYAFPTLFEDVVYTQLDVAGNLHGDLYQGWGAGAVKLALGAEYRHEYGDVTHNLENQPWYDSYELSYGLDYRGTINVVEGYGELNVPLLKDAPLVHYAEIDAAVRETYNQANNESTEPAPFVNPAESGESASHNFPTWKISGIWDVTDWLRLRGTRSRDVRAPQFRELFQSYSVTASGPFATVFNPWTGLEQYTNISTGGTLALKPEVADTWSAGFQIAPKDGWFNRFQFSADWYQITINDPITGPPFGIGAQNIVTGCYDGSTFFCSLITRNGNDIVAVNNSAANLGQYVTRGVDFESDYNLPLESVDKDLPGTLSFRVLASYLYDMIITSGAGANGNLAINYAGQTGPTAAFGGYNTSPKWQFNTFFTYSNGPFSGTIQVRYVGAGTLMALTASGGAPVTPGEAGYSTTNANSINENSVPSAWYVNLAGSYDITKNITFFSNINNLFNKSPPIAPGGNGYPTNPVYFDTYGMTWKVGIRARF